MASLHSFLCRHNILACEQTTFCGAVHQSVATWVVSTFLAVLSQLLQTRTCTCLSVCSQLCGGAHLAVELLGHVVIRCVILEGVSCHSPVKLALTSCMREHPRL